MKYYYLFILFFYSFIYTNYFSVFQDRITAVQKTSTLYLQYINVTNKLIECYENILQPQKRILLRQFVDNCIGRVLELKHELVALEFSEFNFLDDKLLSMQMVPVCIYKILFVLLKYFNCLKCAQYVKIFFHH